MLDDLIDAIELVIDTIFGIREARKALDNDLLSLIRQAHEGKSLSASLISTDHLTTDMLCQPLTAQQLRDMHACTQTAQRRLSLDIAESKGFRNRHVVVLVTLDFEGVTDTGTKISIHMHRAPMHVSLHKERLFIIDDVIASAMY